MLTPFVGKVATDAVVETLPPATGKVNGLGSAELLRFNQKSSCDFSKSRPLFDTF